MVLPREATAPPCEVLPFGLPGGPGLFIVPSVSHGGGFSALLTSSPSAFSLTLELLLSPQLGVWAPEESSLPGHAPRDLTLFTQKPIKLFKHVIVCLISPAGPQTRLK